MKRIGVFVTLLATLGAQTRRPTVSPAATQSVTAIRHWSLGDVTRVAIEVSGDFEFKTDRLHNPERVYYDILNAKPRIDSRRIYSETLDDKRISKIRAAETNPGVTRVVLDLTGPGEATTSKLANPDRLIIELRSESGPGPVTTSTSAAVTTSTPPPATASAPAAVPELPPAPVPQKPGPSLAPMAKVDLSKINPPRPEPPSRPEPGKSEPVVRAKPPETAPAKNTAPPLRQPAPLEVIKAARPTTSAGSTSLVRALGLKISRVVIDPGHGGHDEGTQSPKGLIEKDLVLDVALRLGKMIEERMKVEVIYTRSDDTFIPLEGRTALANEKKADLFLSIHANSSPIPRIAGMETFYLNFPDSKEAAEVASRENASSEKSVFELQDVIQKITLHDKAEESREFAGRVQNSLQTLSAKNFPGIKNRGVKKAPFVVLIGARMPSVLAEIGFLSNSKEEALLKRPDYRQKLAETLFKGMERYAQSLSHFDVVAQAKD